MPPRCHTKNCRRAPLRPPETPSAFCQKCLDISAECKAQGKPWPDVI